MIVNIAKGLCSGLWCAARAVLWYGLGFWAAMAAYYTLPVPAWAAVAIGIGIFALFVAARRERVLRGGVYGNLRSIVALLTTAAVAFWYFGFVKPNPNENFIPTHARNPSVTIDGDTVTVKNVRNFVWRTEDDFSPNYYERVYDVGKISSMYYVLSPIFDLRAVAHAWVSFGFSDGEHVTVSVEARGVKERPFGLFRSMFKQFQLIYVVADERDMFGMRADIWNNELRVYPARTTPDRMRFLFKDMMERACGLERHPEFYNLFTNNCMNNTTYHIRRLGGRSVPAEWRLMLTGFSDRLAYDYGFLDTDLPFEKAREAYRIDEWIRQTTLDDTFSQRLREALRRQGADKAPYP